MLMIILQLALGLSAAAQADYSTPAGQGSVYFKFTGDGTLVNPQACSGTMGAGGNYLENGVRLQGRCYGPVLKPAIVSGNGGRHLRMQTTGAAAPAGSRPRAELAYTNMLPFDRMAFYAFRLMIPPESAVNRENVTISQFWQCSPLGPIAGVRLGLNSSHLIEFTANHQNNNNTVVVRFALTPGKWHSFFMAVRPDPYGKGAMKVWADGRQIADASLPFGTSTAGACDGNPGLPNQSSRIKFGIYKSAQPGVFIINFDDVLGGIMTSGSDDDDIGGCMRGPCAGDMQKFCPGIEPGEGRIGACLNKYEEKGQLSKSCSDCRAERRASREAGTPPAEDRDPGGITGGGKAGAGAAQPGTGAQAGTGERLKSPSGQAAVSGRESPGSNEDYRFSWPPGAGGDKTGGGDKSSGGKGAGIRAGGGAEQSSVVSGGGGGRGAEKDKGDKARKDKGKDREKKRDKDGGKDGNKGKDNSRDSRGDPGDGKGGKDKDGGDKDSERNSEKDGSRDKDRDSGKDKGKDKNNKFDCAYTTTDGYGAIVMDGEALNSLPGNWKKGKLNKATGRCE